MNTGNMMGAAGTMNVNMTGGMQMPGNNAMGGNATPNMASMSGGMSTMSNTGPMAANAMGSNTSLASGGMSPASVSSPIPHMGNMNSLGSPLQPGMGLKPGTQTPPANVLQVVKEVQEEAARQHGSFGKNLPVAGAMPPPAMQRGMNVNIMVSYNNCLVPFMNSNCLRFHL